MDATSLRLAFASRLGLEGFRKFVVRLRQAGRLQYWQERAWREFVDAHPEFVCGVDELLAALRICELHGCELQPDEAKVLRGCRDYADRYLKAKVRRFPNAASEPYSTEGVTFRGETIEVWYCAECRAAELDWQHHHL